MLLPSLTSIWQSPPATTVAGATTGSENSVSELAPTQNRANNLPHEITGHIDSFLDPVSARSFAQTNRNNRQGSGQYFFRQRLKPEFRTQGRDFVADYDNPARRLDQFVPTDVAGKEYLSRSGIAGVLTLENIRNGWLTIELALTRTAEINAALAEGNLNSLTTACLENPIVRDCIVADRVGSQDFFSVIEGTSSPIELFLEALEWRGGLMSLTNLAQPAVQKYLYRGEIRLVQALELSESDVSYLSLPETQEAYESSNETLESFLS